jgi:acetylornithine deacetylase/succinyl-diaminopimelate desuccinylase-like protein
MLPRPAEIANPFLRAAHGAWVRDVAFRSGTAVSMFRGGMIRCCAYRSAVFIPGGGFRMRSRALHVLILLAAITATGATPGPPQAPDLGKLGEEATVWLADLIRINTTNPPGNELAAARYLAGVLEREGIRAEVLESAPGRGIVVARLQAGPLPDPSRALLLLGHTDVVGVEREKWSVDPFGGVIRDGCLWGRGALDDKAMTVANLAVFVALKRSGVPLGRDVIFLAEGDEEAGGEHGIEFAIARHWEKIAAAYALNEGGRVVLKNGRVQYVAVQASEKVPVNVEVIATGPSGHGSVPRRDNPVLRLAAAVAKIGEYVAPAKPNTITRRYFEELAKVEDPELARWMRALETPERFEQAARRLSEASPVWNSMLRNSIAPTMLRGGIRENVVPSEARATLNIRLLPGESIQDVVAELRKLVNDPQIRFEVQPASRQPAPPSSLSSELFQALEKAAPRVFPGSVVVPFMSAGATDSAQLRARNVQAYGVLPFPLTEEDAARMHADDERIPLASLHKGIEFLYTLVEEFVRAPAAPASR